MAKVTKAFEGYQDGEHVLLKFNVGDEIDEKTSLGRTAVEQGWAKAKPAPKNKARSVPQNKSGAALPAGRASRSSKLKRSRKRTTPDG